MTMPLDDVRSITVQSADEPLVITVNAPGPQGPPGVFTLGTVTTTGPGSSASATVSTNADGVAVVNLSIPRGDAGPAGSLSIGTVTSGDSASATITGASPNQMLNLVLPKGDQGPSGAPGAQGVQGLQGPTGPAGTNGKDGAGVQVAGQVATYADLPTNLTSADAGKAYIVSADGKLYVWSGTAFPANGAGNTFVGPAGPANTLTIGTVTNGTAGGAASATITGTAPTQTLNLTLPTGAPGPGNNLAIGTVGTGAAGTNAIATITGASPNQTLNLTIPRGADGAVGATGPTGPAGPTGNGVLVLGVSDPVPAGTSANTVIYRPAVKTATFYWGSGTSFPASGVGAGDTYFHTGLNGLMRYNGTAWRHLGPVLLADSTARNTMSTNYSGILYAGFQVRESATGITYEWTGSTWTLAYRNGDTGWHNVGVAGEVAFQNGWTNYGSGYAGVRYYKSPSGMVVIQGLAAAGTIGSVPVFTLPVGYRTSATLIFAEQTATGLGRLDILSNGNVQANSGGNQWFSLNCEFPAEQ